ncbi:Uncharacterized protein APZ42_014543 [Daphnia magna]|uniref:Uncharacterized protein n=1 Tax=Daphnia magna TaxID=35525 RepID=A0A162PSZ1_9CRUS|nr:Uncharacterized protein APZ42_014543 [Daphnia magna]
MSKSLASSRCYHEKHTKRGYITPATGMVYTSYTHTFGGYILRLCVCPLHLEKAIRR